MTRLVVILCLSCLFSCGSSEALLECERRDNGGPWIIVLGQSNARRLPLRLFAYSVLRVAKGGTGIGEWGPGRVLLDTAIACMLTEPVNAVIWIQGEADTEYEEDALAYYDRLTEVNNLIGPMIVVQTSRGMDYVNVVADAQCAVDPWAIPTDDLTIYDFYHYDADSQAVLVERIEDRLVNGGNLCSSEEA